MGSDRGNEHREQFWVDFGLGASVEGAVKELIADLAESIDPLALTRRVATQACELLPNVDGAAVHLRHGHRSVVVAAHGVLGPLLGSISPIHVDDTGDPSTPFGADAGSVADLLNSVGRQSVLSTPLLRDSALLGWISIVSRKPAAFGDSDIAAMAAVGRFVSTLLTANADLAAQLRELLTDPTGNAVDPAACLLASLVAPDAAKRQQVRAEITDVAGHHQLCAVFQPVCRLSDLKVTGYEGLARFPDGNHEGPDYWFAQAHTVGRGTDLEIMALRAIFESARQIPPDYEIAVNLSPKVAVHPTTRELLRCADRPVTVELTEHDHITAPMYAALKSLRRYRVRLAVDDTGAGSSSLSRIVRLCPDIVKIDRDLTVGVDSDPARQALVVALVHFAREIGAATVAEGIETSDQCAALRDLGVDHGQGFWLGLPRPADRIMGL